MSGAAPAAAAPPLQPICRNCLHFTRHWTDVDNGVCSRSRNHGQQPLIPGEGGEKKRGIDTCPSCTVYTWRGYE